jgi:hypothetical protein
MDRRKLFENSEVYIMNENIIGNILGTTPRARRKEVFPSLDECFLNPIIHKEIHGDKVYVPLDLTRIWSKVD